jgi:hypothetical protein
MSGIVGRVGTATARDALCHGFDPCRQRPRGVAVDFGPKQSGWLINQLGDPSLGRCQPERRKLSWGSSHDSCADRPDNLIQRVAAVAASLTLAAQPPCVREKGKCTCSQQHRCLRPRDSRHPTLTIVAVLLQVPCLDIEGTGRLPPAGILP